LWTRVARSYAGLFRSALTDQNGVFQFSGVAGGTYSILAWDRIPENADRNAAFLASYASRATEVTLGPGSGVNVEVDLIERTDAP
jgi:hypothetical protein